MILYEQDGKTVAYELPDFKEYEEYESFWQRRSEQIQVDSSQIGDMFRWYFERELSLSLLDKEHWLEEMDPGPTKEEYAQFIDKLCAPPEVDDNQYALRRMADLSILSFLKEYIICFTKSELATVYDILDDLYKKDEMYFHDWLDCSLAVAWRLARTTDEKAGWWKECDRLRAIRKKFPRPPRHVYVPADDDRLYASMSISIEDAIDLKREAEKLAEMNHCSVEYVYLNLVEQRENHVQEEQSDELLELLSMDDEIADYEGYLDHLME